jgi:hypothetical protein
MDLIATNGYLHVSSPKTLTLDMYVNITKTFTLDIIYYACYHHTHTSKKNDSNYSVILDD